jgi:anti-sigma B factor antagonist
MEHRWRDAIADTDTDAVAFHSPKGISMNLPATTIAFDGELTIYRAAELGKSLEAALAALAPGSALILDLAQVTEFDSAGVQLLMAAKKTALASQRSLCLVGHSPAVLEVFETLDLAAYFGDALLMPARQH